MVRDFKCTICRTDCTIRVLHFVDDEGNQIRANVPVCTSLSCLVAQGAQVIPKRERLTVAKR